MSVNRRAVLDQLPRIKEHINFHVQTILCIEGIFPWLNVIFGDRDKILNIDSFFDDNQLFNECSKISHERVMSSIKGWPPLIVLINPNQNINFEYYRKASTKYGTSASMYLDSDKEDLVKYISAIRKMHIIESEDIPDNEVLVLSEQSCQLILCGKKISRYAHRHEKVLRFNEFQDGSLVDLLREMTSDS